MEKLNKNLDIYVDEFPWESEDQRLGFLNMVQYLSKFGIEVKLPLQSSISQLIAFYFIQRDHESNEHWAEVVGSQVSEIQDQISLLQRGLHECTNKLDAFMSTAKAQSQTIDLLFDKIQKLDHSVRDGRTTQQDK